MNAKDRLWSLGAALLAIGIVFGAWFGAISPSLDAAARADDDRSAVEMQNAIHETRLVALEEAAARIPELSAERDALAVGLPAGEEYAEFMRQLDALAQQSGVTLSGVTTSAALVYLPPVDEAAPEPVAETTDDAAASDAESDDAAEQTAAPAPDPGAGAPVPFTSALIGSENLAAIPMTISAEGSSIGLADFLNRLQMGSRLVSISTANLTDESELDPGRLDLSGFIYAMPTEQLVP